MIMGCGQWRMCYIWQWIEYYNYYDLLCVYIYVKVSSISKFILMYATVTCMNFVIIVHVSYVMLCVYARCSMCRLLYKIYDIISIACTL